MANKLLARVAEAVVPARAGDWSGVEEVTASLALDDSIKHDNWLNAYAVTGALGDLALGQVKTDYLLNAMLQAVEVVANGDGDARDVVLRMRGAIPMKTDDARLLSDDQREQLRSILLLLSTLCE